MSQNGHATSSPPVISVARLLDNARQLILEAWDQDRHPRFLDVNPRVYRVVMDAKAQELASGRPVTLLGLELRSLDWVPIDRPEVH